MHQGRSASRAKGTVDGGVATKLGEAEPSVQRANTEGEYKFVGAMFCLQGGHVVGCGSSGGRAAAVVEASLLLLSLLLLLRHLYWSTISLSLLADRPFVGTCL